MRTFLTCTISAIVLLIATVTSAQAPPEIDRWTEASQRTAYGRDNGLQSDNQGDPFQLSWGIFNEGSTIFSNQPPSDLEARLNQIYSGGKSEWQPIIASTFDRWASISGLTFNYEANDDGADFFRTTGVTGARADIRIGGRPIDGNSGVLGEAWSPNRDIVLDTSDNFYDNTGLDSIRLRNVMAHEIGHVLGMPHVLNATPSFLMEPNYTSNFDGAQLHDIMMAQWGYGDANEKSNGGMGNDDFATATSLGSLIVDSSKVIGEDARVDGSGSVEVFPDEIDFFTIDDESDVDVFEFTTLVDGGLEIVLESLGFTYNTGPVGGTPTPFNSKARSDLSFELFDENEVSLQFVDSVGLEGIEVLNLESLAAGDYFVKVYGLDNADLVEIDAQFYSLSVSSLTAVPEPSAVCLTLFGCCALVSRRVRRKV